MRDVCGREIVPVVTAAQAAAHDRFAREHAGIPERVLMENAGRALALITHSLFPEGRIVGLAGSGHNGGDTVVALRTLQAWGRDVACVSAASNDAHRELLHGSTLAEIPFADAEPALAAATVVLDGLLGTGASGAPRGRVAELIRLLASTNAAVIALDLPSGTNPDTGTVYDDVVHAAVTVCFGYPKLGLLFHPARAHCGRLISVDIAFPPFAAADAQLITPAWAAARFPQRAPDANKGSSGRLLIVAGSVGMAGAAVIAGNAAVRSGAGLVRIASPAANREILQKSVPEATFIERSPDLDATTMTAVLAGPGMGDSEDTRNMIVNVLTQLPGVPVVLDADALNVFAGDVVSLGKLAHGRELLITPHPKELGRLTGRPVEEIVAAPIDAARSLAQQIDAVVLLKGQPSVVASPSESALINTTGSSDAGVAGMGDQLSGVIGAMLAAGLDARTAAAVGLYYSGRAADLAALGRALTPTDVTSHLAAAFANPGARASDLFPFITFDQQPRW